MVSVANDTFFKNTTLLLNGETTVTPFINDASTNNFALTIAGDTKPVLFNPYQAGYYSNYFDGTGDYLQLPSNTAFNLGAGDFTIEMWVNLQTVTKQGQYFFYCTNFNPNMFLWDNGLIYLRTAETSGNIVTPTASGLIINTWSHVACVRSGNTYSIFINGTLVVSGTSTGVTNTSSELYFGKNLQGHISNFRVVKGTALYTSSFTPSTTPLTAIANTSLLTCQSNRFIDNSTNNFTITKAGDVSVSPNIPFASNSSYSTYGSTYFDGTGDVLTLASGQFPVLGTNNFTMEAWVYTTSVAAGTGGIFDMWNGGTSAFLLRRSSTSLQIYVQGSQTIDSGAILNVNTWFHVAVVRNGTTITLYVNGLSVGTPITSYSTSITGNVALGIGGTATTGNEGWIGYITDARIVNGTAVYTANFTPPTSPLTAITNTSLLTLQYNGGATNQGFIDNSNFNNIITRNGNPSQGTFSPYSVTGWSNFFDGTGDYLYSSASSTNAMGTGDYTVEAWIYVTAAFGTTGSGRGAIISNRGQESATNAFMLQHYNGKIYFGTSNIDVIVGNTTLSTNTWYHVVVSRSSGTVRLFLNGVSDATAVTGNSTNHSATNAFYVGIDGAYGAYPFTGYISNARLVKGTAVYTSAFTPPTTPLTAITNTSLLTCQSNRLIDNSPNSFAITKNGDTSVQAFGPFGSVPEAVPISYSNYFDGTGDQLITTTSANLALQSNDFTVELWYYPTGKVQSYPVLISNGNFGSNKWQINDRHQAFPTKVSVNLYAGSSGDGWLVSTTTISVNTWYHVALVRSGSTFTLYINGIAEQSKTLSGSITAATDFITLGQDQNQGVTCYTGYISNARIVKGTAVYTSNFTPSTTPLTAIANTSLLTCQSTTMIDNSTNRFTITANGNVTPRIFNPFGYTAQSATSYTPSLHGGSIYLDGTVDNLYSSTISKYGSTNHTIECWVFFNNVSSRQSILNSAWSTGSFATDGGWTLDIAGVSAGGLSFALGTMASGSFWIGPSTGVGSFTVGQWYHIAIVRNSTTVTIYSNGVSIATGTLTASTTVMSNMGVLRIGAYDGNGFPFNGYISDVRVSSGALYTSNFVSPTVPLTPTVTIGANTFTAGILVNGATGGIIDQHGTNVLETVGNTQLSTAVKKYNSASMYFDGTGDYLTTPAKDPLSFGTGDFTVEAWVYFASIAADRGILGSSGVGGYDFVWRTSNGLNIGRINTAFDNSFAFTPVANTWYHIAYSRSGTSLRAFVDGTQVGTTATNSNAYNSVTAVIVGGSTTADRLMNGYIDDLRITKGYARYTSNFTPPSALITK